MKTIRHLIIGLVIGGGLGAKVGGYLASVQNLLVEWNWIKAGLIYGSLLGLTIAIGIMIALALSVQWSENNPMVSQKSFKDFRVSAGVDQANS